MSSDNYQRYPRISATDQAQPTDQADAVVITDPSPTLTFATLKPLAMIVGLAGFACMFIYAGVLVYALFADRLGAGPLEAGLAVAASVGVVLGTLLIALTTGKNSVRGLAGLFLFVWLIVTLALVSLEAASRGGILAVPDSLSSIGRVMAALLAAIALVPAISIPLVARMPDHYPSAAAAIGGYVGFVAKGVAVAASIFASAYFGLSRGMPVEVAILCGFVIESCFLWAYLSLIKATQRRDRFDMALWALAVVTFGAFIALISIETISTLAKIQVAFLRPFADAGATLFTSAVGLGVVLTVLVHVLTSLINSPAPRRAGDQVIDVEGRPLARRIAGRIRGARSGWAEIQDAIRQPALLAPPRPAQTFADDAPATGTPTLWREEPRTSTRVNTEELPSFLAPRPENPNQRKPL